MRRASAPAPLGRPYYHTRRRDAQRRGCRRRIRLRPDADDEPLSENPQRPIYLPDRRAVIEIEKPIDLRPLPAKPPRQFRFRHAPRADGAIELHLCRGQRRQADHPLIRLAWRCRERQMDLAASKFDSAMWLGGRRRNIFAPGDPRRQRLLDRVCSALQRILFIFPECGHFRQVGAGHEDSSVAIRTEDHLVHEQPSYRLLIKAKILFDLVDETSAELLVAAVHRQLRPALAPDDGKMAAPALVVLEGATLFRQPPP
jgi:hypothetical protein